MTLDTFAAQLDDATRCARAASARLCTVPPLDAPAAHRLRNRLGALEAALDVYAGSEHGTPDAIEAHEVAVRQAAAIAVLLEGPCGEAP